VSTSDLRVTDLLRAFAEESQGRYGGRAPHDVAAPFRESGARLYLFEDSDGTPSPAAAFADSNQRSGR
jgi:hypothetical protein